MIFLSIIQCVENLGEPGCGAEIYEECEARGEFEAVQEVIIAAVDLNIVASYCRTGCSVDLSLIA